VVKVLPNRIFELETGFGGKIRAHLGTEMKMKYTRLLAGERVKVEISPYDSGRGRITERIG